MSHWVRLWDDMPTDPKWRVVARRSGRPISEVIAVFVFMMTNAANASERVRERGELSGWSDEDVAVAIDADLEHVTAIREAMQGKVLEGDKLTGWERRQTKRDGGAAERARNWRENKKNNNKNQQQSDDDRSEQNERSERKTERSERERTRSRTTRTERTPLDKIRIDKIDAASAASARERPPNEFDEALSACCAALGEKSPADAVIGPMLEKFREFGREQVLETLQSEARRTRQKPVKTWKLWATIVAEALSGTPPPAAIANGKSPSEQESTAREIREKNWRNALAAWREKGRYSGWNETVLGSRPDEPGCDVPDAILAEFGLSRVPYPQDDEAAA